MYLESLLERYIREKVVKNEVGVSMCEHPGTREEQVEARVLIFKNLAEIIARKQGTMGALRALRNAKDTKPQS